MGHTYQCCVNRYSGPSQYQITSAHDVDFLIRNNILNCSFQVFRFFLFPIFHLPKFRLKYHIIGWHVKGLNVVSAFASDLIYQHSNASEMQHAYHIVLTWLLSKKMPGVSFPENLNITFNQNTSFENRNVSNCYFWYQINSHHSWWQSANDWY